MVWAVWLNGLKPAFSAILAVLIKVTDELGGGVVPVLVLGLVVAKGLDAASLGGLCFREVAGVLSPGRLPVPWDGCLAADVTGLALLLLLTSEAAAKSELEGAVGSGFPVEASLAGTEPGATELGADLLVAIGSLLARFAITKAMIPAIATTAIRPGIHMRFDLFGGGGV